MATSSTHYTNFGVSMQPDCADGAGFVPYNEKHFDALMKAVRAGEDFEEAAERIGASEGTQWVAEMSLDIEDWQESQ